LGLRVPRGRKALRAQAGLKAYKAQRDHRVRKDHRGLPEWVWLYWTMKEQALAMGR